MKVCIRWAVDAGVGLIKPKFVTQIDNPAKIDLEILLDETFLWQVHKMNGI